MARKQMKVTVDRRPIRNNCSGGSSTGITATTVVYETRVGDESVRVTLGDEGEPVDVLCAVTDAVPEAIGLHSAMSYIEKRDGEWFAKIAAQVGDKYHSYACTLPAALMA